MKFFKLALLVGGLMLLSSTAYSGMGVWRTGPSLVDSATPFPLCARGITPGASCFLAWKNSSNEQSPMIVVSAEYATVNFDSDVLVQNAGGASMQMHKVVSSSCSGTTTPVLAEATIMIFRGALDPTTAWIPQLTGDSSAFLSGQGTKLYTGCYFIRTQTSTSDNSMVILTGAPSQFGR